MNFSCFPFAFNMATGKCKFQICPPFYFSRILLSGGRGEQSSNDATLFTPTHTLVVNKR